MADQSSNTLNGSETPEAFLADRQRFWNGFTSATLASIIFMVVLLVLMALFLL